MTTVRNASVPETESRKATANPRASTSAAPPSGAKIGTDLAASVHLHARHRSRAGCQRTHRCLYVDGRGVRKGQTQRNALARLQRGLQASQHDVVATRPERDRLAGRQFKAAHDWAHAHDAALICGL